MSAPRLAYVLDGPNEAPVLVLAPSLGTTRDLWMPQLPALAGRWRLLRIDLPGHGESPVWRMPVTVEAIGRAALDLLDSLRFHRVSWCGLSLGGAVGQWVAAHAPYRVERLVLCCTAARFNAPDAYVQRAATVRAQGMTAVSEAVLDRWFSPEFRRRRPEVVSAYRTMLESIPAEGYAACCEAVAEFDARTYLSQIVAPTLVVVGGEDRATPLDLGEALCAGISGARLRVIPGAAHLANVEQPMEVTEEIQTHLCESSGRTGDG